MLPGRRTRTILTLLVGTIAALMTPAPSHASTVQVSAGTLTYTAAPGEANNVSISKSGSSFNLVDSGAGTMTAVPPCTAGGGLANCSAVGVTAIQVTLGDGIDAVAVNSVVGVPITEDGGSGDDTFTQKAQVNADTMIGGSGTDTADYGARGFGMDATMGDGTANDGADCLPVLGVLPSGCEKDNLGSDIENLVATSGFDVVVGNDSDNDIDLRLSSDIVAGAKGNDTLDGCCQGKLYVESDPSNGNDLFSSHSEVDTVTYGPAPAQIEALAPGQFPGRTGDLDIDADGAADDGESGELDNVSSGIDNIIGGSGNDNIVGGTYLGNSVNVLHGGPGNDALNGAGGNDQLFGDEDDDSFYQGTAPDGGDTMIGGAGTDTADYSARAASSPLAVTSGDATANDGNSLPGFEAEPGVLSSPRDNVQADVENINGGAGSDTITGNTLDNRIAGGDGSDTLSAVDGDDVLYEGTASNGGDNLNGGLGSDTIDYSDRTAAVNVTLETSAIGNDGANAELDNAQNDENVNGGSAGDTLTGQTSNATTNFLSGNQGADTLTGNGGDDFLVGGPGAGDNVSAGAGNDDVQILDGAIDTADCGPDSDTVTADSVPADVLSNCETVDLSDSGPPDTEIDSGPDDPTNQTTATFTFSGSDDKTAPENLDFECSLDSAPATDCESGDSFAVPEGAHHFEVAAIDEEGKVDLSPAEFDWDVDTTNPAAPGINGPAGGDPTADATPEFSFTGEAGGGFECRIDSDQEADFAPCSASYAAPHQDDGSHTIDVRQRDDAGNAGEFSSKSFTVDTAAPAAPTITGPAGGNPTSDTTPTFILSGEAGGEFQCRIDSTMEGDFATCSSPYTAPAQSEGAHTLDVRQRDDAGNTGPASSKAFTVDTMAPDTAITSGPADTSTVTSNDQTFTYLSEAGAHFECALDTPTFTSCPDDGITYTDLAEGSHTFQVRAFDAAGNRDGSPASSTFTISSPPAVPGGATSPTGSGQAPTAATTRKCKKGKRLKKTRKGKKRCVKKKKHKRR